MAKRRNEFFFFFEGWKNEYFSRWQYAFALRGQLPADRLRTADQTAMHIHISRTRATDMHHIRTMDAAHYFSYKNYRCAIKPAGHLIGFRLPDGVLHVLQLERPIVNQLDTCIQLHAWTNTSRQNSEF